jgi:ABC-type branched-subunit amino acid transport system ATPase component
MTTSTVSSVGSSPGAPALRVSGLVKRFSDVTAVNGVDLEVRAGECFGMLGPNGAGKTTTIEILEGLTQHDEGTVEVFGQSWGRGHDDALRAKLGIALQETELPEKLTVEEVVALFRSFYASGRDVDALLRDLQLDEKRKTRVGKLSGGTRQRTALACALVGDPQVLFLDEPTTGLDRRPASKCGSSCKPFAAAAAPSSSPPTTWKRRRGCAIASRSSTTARSSPSTHPTRSSPRSVAARSSRSSSRTPTRSASTTRRSEPCPASTM